MKFRQKKFSLNGNRPPKITPLTTPVPPRRLPLKVRKRTPHGRAALTNRTHDFPSSHKKQTILCVCRRQSLFRFPNFVFRAVLAGRSVVLRRVGSEFLKLVASLGRGFGWELLGRGSRHGAFGFFSFCFGLCSSWSQCCLRLLPRPLMGRVNLLRAMPWGWSCGAGRRTQRWVSVRPRQPLQLASTARDVYMATGSDKLMEPGTVVGALRVLRDYFAPVKRW